MKVTVKKKDNSVPVVIGTEFIKLEAALKFANEMLQNTMKYMEDMVLCRKTET